LATLLEFFDVPPDADDAFLADWRRERGAAGAQLYRAIRDDAPVRFVSVAPGGAYELVHEDGDVDSGGGVFQITTFAGAGAEFLPAWQRLHAIERGRRGYLGTRLYRDGDRYVAIARWSSPLMVFRTTQQPAFQRAAGDVPGASATALYTVPTGSSIYDSS
jgi:antibiotic biosynthesis monooxygenase